jgi:hypothetical protein
MSNCNFGYTGAQWSAHSWYNPNRLFLTASGNEDGNRERVKEAMQGTVFFKRSLHDVAGESFSSSTQLSPPQASL